MWHKHNVRLLSPRVQDAGCVELDEEVDAVASLPAGRIASFFYLKHATMATWSRGLAAHMEPREVELLSSEKAACCTPRDLPHLGRSFCCESTRKHKPLVPFLPS